MTENEMDAEFGKLLRERADVKRTVACLESKLDRAARAFRTACAAIETKAEWTIPDDVGKGLSVPQLAQSWPSEEHIFRPCMNSQGGSERRSKQRRGWPRSTNYCRIEGGRNDPRRSRSRPQAGSERRDPREAGEGALSPDGAATGPRSKVRCSRPSPGRRGCDRRAGRLCPASGRGFLSPDGCACRQTPGRTDQDASG